MAPKTTYFLRQSIRDNQKLSRTPKTYLKAEEPNAFIAKTSVNHDVLFLFVCASQ